MSNAPSRAPRSIEEYLVGQFELASGCTHTPQIPVPDTCSWPVQTLGLVASFPIITLMFAGIFGFVIWEVYFCAVND